MSSKILPSAVLIAMTFPVAVHAAADSKNFMIGTYEEVFVEGDMRVEINNDAPPSARAEGDAKLVDSLKIERVGKVVRVGYRPMFRIGTGAPQGTVVIKLAGRNIRKLSLRGGGSIKVNFIKAPLGQFDIRGPGQIEIGNIQADKMQVLLNGNGKFSAAKGTATTGTVSINGTANFDAPDFNFGSLVLLQKGAANTTTRASREVKISNEGPGRIDIGGSGYCIIQMAGSGTINCPSAGKSK